MRLVLWLLIVLGLIVPLFLAASSPLLAWRDPVYILAGFAGVVAFALMLVQPMLAAGLLPGVALVTGRRMHRWVGGVIILGVLIHVGGLWVTSPPDVVDALLLVSPAPFSNWGVLAFAALVGAGVLAVYRRRFRLAVWRVGHSALVTVAVLGTVLHAWKVDGTMEIVSKAGLCLAVILALGVAMVRLKAWRAIWRQSLG
jgi:predicted ferric reductase